VPVYAVPQTVMNDVAGFNFHRGCLAIGIRPPARSWREIVGASRRQDVTAEANTQHVIAAYIEQDPAFAPSARIVVLERVSNVDNIGSVFRNAAAFGAHGILLQTDCADPLYRKAIRTSMAASLTMPYARAPWPGTLRELAADGWATVAMTPAHDAPLLRDVAPTLRDRRVAIVLGHEGEGLSDTAIGACTHRARIAMANGVDSVNVATAAAIALYEICNGVGGHLERTLTD
jgi:tRNA G18 (ribose-2'-O)-methylase SpoU